MGGSYSKYIGVTAVILVVVVVNVALILTGIVEETITDVVTEPKTITLTHTTADATVPFGASDPTSFYGNKTEEGATLLPPDVSIGGASTCAGGALLGTDRRSVTCAGTGGFVGTSITVSYLAQDTSGADSSSLGIFRLVPFLYVIVFVVLPMAGAVYGGFKGGGTIAAVVAQFVVLIVGLILTTILQDSLNEALVIFSYATEYNGVSAILGLVLLLYVVTLIVSMIGSARSGVQSFKGGM